MPISEITPEQKVLHYIKEHRLIAPAQKLVVAVSGGPDSVCLLHILWKLRQELDIDLHVAHLNHKLRGDESDADAAYVEVLARKLGIPATIESRDVKAYRAKRRLSLEEAAREVRYAFLAEVVSKTGAEKVSVGHTATDHTETILMHLIRGAGPRGLRGLLPLNTIKSGANKLTIVRPLLELTREETAAYCRRHRLQPCTDSSNLSPALFRNNIRLELIPLLKRYNPQVVEALQRTAHLAADDFSFIDENADRAWVEVVSEQNSALILDKKKFLSLPTALERNILRRAIDSLLGDLKDIEAKHIEDILNALEKPAGRSIGLPEGLQFTIEYDKYILAQETAAACPFTHLDAEYPLTVPGRTSIPGGIFVASVIDSKKREYDEDGFTAYVDFDKTGSALKVRPRFTGDRFQPLGLAESKKLNVFMIDARIPRAWRPRVPIVTAPGQIIWVTGWRIDERVKVTDSTGRVLRLEYKPA
jgi:tRNA(Ile)-lysidine synthase